MKLQFRTKFFIFIIVSVLFTEAAQAQESEYSFLSLKADVGIIHMMAYKDRIELEKGYGFEDLQSNPDYSLGF